MPKVQVTSQIEIELDEMLKGVAHLENSELEQFADKVIALRAQRRAPSLSHAEAELLQRINTGVPTEVRLRYAELDEKLHGEVLTPSEQLEFIEITDQIEQADAERMQDLVLLAQLRNVSVDMLMTQLGIRHSPDA